MRDGRREKSAMIETRMRKTTRRTPQRHWETTRERESRPKTLQLAEGA